MLQQRRRPVTPDRLEQMKTFGTEAGRLFQRHRSGAGGMIKVLADDVMDLAAAYERSETERREMLRQVEEARTTLAIVILNAGGGDDAAG